MQTALAIRPQQHVSLFGASEPIAIIERATSVATALKGVIQAQKLISNIQGKEYPRCEAWTLLGTMLGVFPVLQWSKPVEDGWEARVEAKTRDGAVVGAAEAQCLRTEQNWSNRDDFAVRSMAQTRATAKALRMPLGFVMTLAGYEATPAEEMHFEKAPKSSNTRNLTGGNHNLGASGGSGPAGRSLGSEGSRPAERPQPTQAPARTVSPSGAAATAKHRDLMLELLVPIHGQEGLLNYARAKSFILPSESGEGLGDIPLRYVPIDERQLNLMKADIELFYEGAGDDKPPFVNPEPKQDTGKSTTFVKREVSQYPSVGGWRDALITFGKHKGKTLGQLERNSLAWYCRSIKASATYTNKTTGKEVQKSQQQMSQDIAFRKSLDAAMAELGITDGGEQ